MHATSMSEEVRAVRIASISPAAKDQSVLALERDAALEPGPPPPGQYCQLGVAQPGIVQPGMDGHFFLTDPPAAGAFRFRLRAGGPAADALRKLAAGTEVR